MVAPDGPAFVLESTLAEALPGPWVIPEEKPNIPILRFNDRRVVEVSELLAGFLSGRLSSDGALQAVTSFYARWPLTTSISRM